MTDAVARAQVQMLIGQMVDLNERVRILEDRLSTPAIGDNTALTTRMQELAAKQQATEHLYAPLRSDTRAVIDLAAFARRLIDMQDLGHAVTEEVRELAKRALGLK